MLATVCEGLFLVELVAWVFGHPIQQHCSHKSFSRHSKAMYPFKFDAGKMDALHVVWVPTRSHKNAAYSHIVAAIAHPIGLCNNRLNACGALVFGKCLLAFNTGKVDENWVECCFCKQWYHCCCLGVDHDDITNDTVLACGCCELQGHTVAVE